MGRKPKAQAEEEISSSPVSDEQEYVIPEEILKTTINIDTTNVDVKTYSTTSPSIPSIESKVMEEMQWAFWEIMRCNDYIFAKADLDRRFTVYRDELAEYRYKIRQLSLNPNYPYISEKLMPIRPDVVPDV